MSSAPTFTGVSSYASDLVQVITRAVKIASMPLTQLTNQKQDLSAQQSALAGIDQKFTALQDTLDQVSTALGPTSYSATSSDSTSVTASVSAGAAEGDYTIDVINAGSSSVAISNASLPAVADPNSDSISSASELTLTVAGGTFSIKPGSASLTSLAKAINDASAGVRASLVNTGSNDAPQYRLILRSDALGAIPIELREGAPTQTPPGSDLLQSLSVGAKAQYTVEGLGTTLESSSRTVNIAPGLTVDLLRASSGPVTISITRSGDSVASAISAFVEAYNAVVDSLDAQMGETAGALSGQPVVRAAYAALRQLTQYGASSGAVQSLTRMGVELDRYGKLSFNESKLSAAGIASVADFLGDSQHGFLKAANAALNSMEATSSGVLQSAIKTTAESITRQDDMISETQRRISDLEASLTERMAQADTLLATLESQRDYMKNLFLSMMKLNASS